MAGPRQPTELLVVKGKKHLSKGEIEERKAKEVKAPSDKVKAPSYLDKELKREFNKISKQLLAIKILTNLDVDALARFITARKLYLNLTQKLLDNPQLIIDDPRILNSQDKLFKQCRSSASDLGLTITSRCKLVIPQQPESIKIEEVKPQNKFTKFVK